MLGELDRALEVMTMAIRKRFYPAEFFRTHCRFIEPLRSHQRFRAVLAEAEGREADARRALAGTLA